MKRVAIVMSEPDLQAVLFDNAIAFWTGNNTDFFKGSIIKKAAARRRAELIGSSYGKATASIAPTSRRAR